MKREYSFKTRQRIKENLSFEIVKRKGKTLKGRWLVASVLRNNLHYSRLGISISARTIKRSVDRNRLKRLIREVFRLQGKRLPKGVDIVVRSKRPFSVLNFKEVETDLLTIFKEWEERWGRH